MRGFSLLEVIIAIGMLGVGVTAAAALMAKTMSSGTTIRAQLIAAHLAQEGMEVIHNIRNTNWIKQKDAPATLWDDGLIDGNSCVEFNSFSLVNPCDGESRRLYFFNNRYTHASTQGVVTDFLRHVEISRGLDGDEPYLLVKSIAKWSEGSMSAEEKLYNWK